MVAFTTTADLYQAFPLQGEWLRHKECSPTVTPFSQILADLYTERIHEYAGIAAKLWISFVFV